MRRSREFVDDTLKGVKWLLEAGKVKPSEDRLTHENLSQV